MKPPLDPDALTLAAVLPALPALPALPVGAVAVDAPLSPPPHPDIISTDMPRVARAIVVFVIRDSDAVYVMESAYRAKPRPPSPRPGRAGPGADPPAALSPS